MVVAKVLPVAFGRGWDLAFHPAAADGRVELYSCVRVILLYFSSRA